MAVDTDPKQWKIVPYGDRWGIERVVTVVLPCETRRLAEETLEAIQAGRLKFPLTSWGMWRPKK